MKLVKQASGKTTIKMSKKEWTDLGKKAGWLKESSGGWANLTPSDLVERLESINWVIVTTDEHGAYPPAGKRFITFSKGPKNFSRNYEVIRESFKKLSKDLTFLFKNPFKVPKYFNYETLKIEEPKEEPHPTVRFKDLHKIDEPFLIMHKGEWKNIEDIDYSNFTVMFEDEEIVKYNYTDLITYRLLE